MQCTWFVQVTHPALVLAVCVGLVSPALTWADSPNDRPLVSGSVPDVRHIDVDVCDSPVMPMADSIDDLSPAQVREVADQLLSDLGVAAHIIVLTMINWDLPTTQSIPVPETYVPMNVQPPPSLTDIPGNGPPIDPPTTQESPEPGTLLAGLAGAGAYLLHCYRRRRARRSVADESEEMSEKAVELAM